MESVRLLDDPFFRFAVEQSCIAVGLVVCVYLLCRGERE